VEGATWIPKKKFTSEEEIVNANLPVTYKWHSYDCKVCGFKHISNKDKKRVKR
jgi:hypothetical protein